MAITYKVLGQTGDASTEATLYTTPVATVTKIKVTVANRAGTAATFRIAIVPGGVTTANEHYVSYDHPLDANASLTSTPFTLSANDVVRVKGSTTTVSFTVFGVEKT